MNDIIHPFLQAVEELKKRPGRPPIVYRIHYEEDTGFIKFFGSSESGLDLPKIILKDNNLIKIFNYEGTAKYHVIKNKIKKKPVNNPHYSQLKQIFTIQETEGCAIIYVTEKGFPSLLKYSLTREDLPRYLMDFNTWDYYVKRREYNDE